MSGYLDNECGCSDTILDLLARVETLESSLAATIATQQATYSADREVFVSPTFSNNWAFRTGLARDAGVETTSLSDRLEWVWEEGKMGFLTNAIVRVTDTAGRPGLPVTVHWRALGAGPVLLASVTSAGDGTTQDLTLNFSNAVEGPGIFIFGALTPAIGPPGTYLISRCRIRA